MFFLGLQVFISEVPKQSGSALQEQFARHLRNGGFRHQESVEIIFTGCSVYCNSKLWKCSAKCNTTSSGSLYCFRADVPCCMPRLVARTVPCARRGRGPAATSAGGVIVLRTR